MNLIGRLFIFPAILLLAGIAIIAAPLKITIASDSTAATFPPTDPGKRWGWGQILTNHFSANVTVNNLAASGRSSKSFYDEGKWAACLASHAAYYFIQFGHNDSKTSDPTRYTEPSTTFKEYLALYVTQARASNGIPVFLTPPTRRNFTAEHKLALDTLQDYARAMREFAASNNVPLLDLLPATIDFYEFIGQTRTPFYQADDTSTTTVTNDDSTHFNEAGARQHCYSIVESLLLSTDTNLAPLQAEVRHSGVPVQIVLPTNASVHFQGSFDLANWRAYGKTNAFPASTVRRYLFNHGESRAFYRARAVLD